MPADVEPSRAEREAAAWFELLTSPVVPQAEIERFQAWHAASDENRRAYAASAAAWEGLGPALASLPREVLQGAPVAANDRAPLRDVAPRPAQRSTLAAYAALAAALILALLFVPLPDGLFAPASAYATSVREVRWVNLEDGSRVQLSPLASMRVLLSGDERRVILSEGVGYFEVARDTRPFVVATPFGEVRAVGTAFVVRIDAEDAVVTVLDGVVSASPARGRSLIAHLAPPPHLERADAGSEIRLGRRLALAQLTPAAAQNRLAWRDGHVALNAALLADAALEVTRFSGERFVFADPVLARIRVSGYFDGGDVDAFLEALRLNFGIEAIRHENRVLLRRSPPT